MNEPKINWKNCHQHTVSEIREALGAMAQPNGIEKFKECLLIKAAALEMHVVLLRKDLAEKDALIYELWRAKAEKMTKAQARALVAKRKLPKLT